MISGTTTLSDCLTAWTPAIGDPTPLGWATTAGYLVTAVLAVGAAWRDRADPVFWATTALVLGLLGLNKQLDLQTALLDTGRCMAEVQGWYAQRRAVQFAVIVPAVALVASVALAALVRFRHALRHIGLALAGLVLLGAFVAARALQFNHLGALIPARGHGEALHLGLEVAGIALIALNALWRLLKGRHR